MLPLLLTFMTAVSTLAGGWIAVRERRRVHVLLGFGAGVLLGASFFDLLPEAVIAADKQGWSTRATLALPVFGFLLFYGADRFVETQICPTGDCETDVRRRIGRLSALGLITHSALDGASIAAATLVSWRVGLIVAVGIVAHDLSDGLNTMLVVTRGELAGPREYRFLFADALAPVLGGVIVLESKISVQGLMVFLGLTAGCFLFTATDELLPEAHRRSATLVAPIATLGGVLFHLARCRLRVDSRLDKSAAPTRETPAQTDAREPPSTLSANRESALLLLSTISLYRLRRTSIFNPRRICTYSSLRNLPSLS